MAKTNTTIGTAAAAKNPENATFNTHAADTNNAAATKKKAATFATNAIA
jgi:hypothetical protein